MRNVGKHIVTLRTDLKPGESFAEVMFNRIYELEQLLREAQPIVNRAARDHDRAYILSRRIEEALKDQSAT